MNLKYNKPTLQSGLVLCCRSAYEYDQGRVQVDSKYELSTLLTYSLRTIEM